MLALVKSNFLLLRRVWHCAATIKDHLYVVGGGWDEITPERYSPRTDQWEQIANLNIPRCNAGKDIVK